MNISCVGRYLVCWFFFDGLGVLDGGTLKLLSDSRYRCLVLTIDGVTLFIKYDGYATAPCSLYPCRLGPNQLSPQKDRSSCRIFFIGTVTLAVVHEILKQIKFDFLSGRLQQCTWLGIRKLTVKFILTFNFVDYIPRRFPVWN